MVHSLKISASMPPSKLPFNTRIQDPPTFKRLFMSISSRLPNEEEWALLHLIHCRDLPTGLIPPFIDALTLLSIHLLNQPSSDPLFAPNTNRLLLYSVTCLHNLAINNASALMSIPETFELLNSLLDLNTLFKDEMHIKKLSFAILNSLALNRWLPTGKQLWLFKKACFYLTNDDRYFVQQAAQLLSTMIKVNPHHEKQFVFDEIIKYTERLVQLIVPRGADIQTTGSSFIDHTLMDQSMICQILELIFYATWHSEVIKDILYVHPRDVISILIYYLGHSQTEVEGIPMYAALILNKYPVMDLEIIYRNIQVQGNQEWWIEWYTGLCLDSPVVPQLKGDKK